MSYGDLDKYYMYPKLSLFKIWHIIM